VHLFLRLVLGDTPGVPGRVTSSHDEHVKREFARQAASFEDPGYSFGDRRLAAWILEHVPVAPDDLVLDVAAGTGHVARSYAPHARQVVAIDVTPEMLSVGKGQADAAGISNVLFERGDAASLPYLDGSFDLVVSRFAVHHFERPEVQIGEMVRVCRSGGRVAVVDLVVADGQPAEVLNEIERRRDPSHTEALSLDRLESLFESAGARVAHVVDHDQTLDAERWLAQAGPSGEVADVIREQLRADADGGPATGMRPFLSDGALEIVQRWAIVVAEA
jgi:ubiquinone/menaquinone biosynthesis C-methylase UbiE